MEQKAVFYSGNINNPSVIFVHGFPYDHNMWNAQVEDLKNDFYCVTYDIRGLGEAPAGNGQYTLEDLSDDLITLAASLKIKPVVCGLSMGGYITLRALEKNEDTFKAAILCDTKSEADNDENKIRRAGAIKKINTEGAPGYVESFIPTCFSERYIKESSKKYKEVVEHSKTFDPIGIKACLLAMAARTDTTNNLSNLELPVLVLCGELDKLSPPESMKKLADTIMHSEYSEIKGAGHMTPIESPERVTYLIKAFLHKVT